MANCITDNLQWEKWILWISKFYWIDSNYYDCTQMMNTIKQVNITWLSIMAIQQINLTAKILVKKKYANTERNNFNRRKCTYIRFNIFNIHDKMWHLQQISNTKSYSKIWSFKAISLFSPICRLLLDIKCLKIKKQKKTMIAYTKGK